MRKKVIVAVLSLLLGVMLAGFFVQAKSERIGVIYLAGPIDEGSLSSVFRAGHGAEEVVRELNAAQNDPFIRAVVIRVNSPGGSAAASQEIGDEIMRTRAKGKKVVVSMGDSATSGAYWIACAADKILAEPATVTGSIGVITRVAQLKSFYEKTGMSVEVFKSGPYKDMGSSERPLTSDERRLFQTMIDDVYTQFVNHVAQGRHLSIARVKTLADGRVYTGRQALEMGLVDKLGNFNDAVNEACALSGINRPMRTKNLSRTLFSLPRDSESADRNTFALPGCALM